MALESISVAASAQRLQARNDSDKAYLRQLRDRQAVEDARNKQRDAEVRRQDEIYNSNRREALNAIDDRQRALDRARSVDLIAQNARDDRIDQTVREREAFVARTTEENAIERSAVEAQISEAALRRDAQYAETPASISFQAFLSERDTRLSDRATQDARQAASTERDYARSARSVDTLRTDPSQLPDTQTRGGIVDFSA